MCAYEPMGPAHANQTVETGLNSCSTLKPVSACKLTDGRVNEVARLKVDDVCKQTRMSMTIYRVRKKLL